jgi:hypothetical protein
MSTEAEAGKENVMTHQKMKIATLAAMAAAALAAAAFAPPAHADAQYKSDRAYCMSGQASEARDLCLKEAAAAQADRQRGSSGSQGTQHRQHGAKPGASGSPDKGASAS